MDNELLRPLFIDDWPRVKEDHDKISNKIVEVFDEFQRSKKRVNELSNFKSEISQDFLNDQKKTEFSLLDNRVVKKRGSKDSFDKNLKK